MMRRAVRAGLTLTTVGILAGAGFLSPALAGAAAPTVATGDVTGDGVADRVTLSSTTGADGTLTCLALVQTGKRNGSFSGAKPVVLATPENRQVDPSLQECPDSPIVFKGTTPAGNRLGAVYTTSLGERGTNVYDLTGKTVKSGSAARVTTFAAGFGGSFGVQDFDGDGTTDFWRQGTDQGEGSAFWQRRGDTFVQIFRSRPNQDPYSPGLGFQFVDLNHNGGVDVLVGTAGQLGVNAAQAVDGKTGAVATLAEGIGPTGDIYGYALAVVDLDHDGYPDIQVQPLSDTGTNPAPLYFRNASQGGRWQFTAVAPTRS